MTHEFDLNPQFIQKGDGERESLAGYGYQDPLYSPVDGMSSPSVSYDTSLGSVSASDPFSAIEQAANKNNNWSAEQAEKQMEFQTSANDKAMAFSAEQAALNRSWQAEMSNTAHQREVVDLQKAGLNPVLSATGGNGASVGSGATAAGVTSAGAKGDTDESLTMAIMSYMAKMLDAQTSILNTQTSANATMANSELMSAASRYASDLSYALGMKDINHITGDIISGVLDPYAEGLGTVSQNAALTASGKVKNWLGEFINNIGKDTRKDPGYYGVSYKNESDGSHMSGKFYEEKGSTEKAIANARAVLANAAQSSGLNLWKVINDATNGTLVEKAKKYKK